MPRLGWELAIEQWISTPPAHGLPEREIVIKRVGKVLALVATEAGEEVASDTVKMTSPRGLLDGLETLAQELTHARRSDEAKQG